MFSSLRAAEWSLKEMERKYNVALEKAVMLEGEVTAKAVMTEEVQRLKDELRGKNRRSAREENISCMEAYQGWR